MAKIDLAGYQILQRDGFSRSFTPKAIQSRRFVLQEVKKDIFSCEKSQTERFVLQEKVKKNVQQLWYQDSHSWENLPPCYGSFHPVTGFITPDVGHFTLSRVYHPC